MGNKQTSKIGIKKRPTRKKKLACAENVMKRYKLMTNANKCESNVECLQLSTAMQESTNDSIIITLQPLERPTSISGPFSSERLPHGPTSATSDMDAEHQDDSLYDDVNTKTRAETYVNAYDSESCNTTEVPVHANYSCNVCRNDIIGFRYSCVQCLDWHMCATCESRGEHAAHYVLRVPVPVVYAESEAVLAAIRKHIDDLLQLKNEIHEVTIKEEMVEVKEEFDVSEQNLSYELSDRNVLEETTSRENLTAYPSDDVPAHTANTHMFPPDDPKESEVRTAVMMLKTSSRESLTAYPPDPHPTHEANRHMFPPDDPEDSGVSAAATILQTIKTEPQEDPLLIDETISK